MLPSSSLVVQQCSLCSRTGRVRCCVCKSWYCTALCQANHWPVHRRVCVPLPGLEWPDGSRYDGQAEDVSRTGQLVELEHKVSDESSMSMKDVFVGRARIENTDMTAQKSSQQQASGQELHGMEKSVPSANNQEVAQTIKKNEKTLPRQPIVSSPSPAKPATACKVKQSSSSIMETKQPTVNAKPLTPQVKPASIPTQFIPSQVRSAASSAKSVLTPVKPVLSPAKQVTKTAEPAPIPVKPNPAPVKTAPIPAKVPAVQEKPATLPEVVSTKTAPPQSPSVQQSVPSPTSSTPLTAKCGSFVSYLLAYQSSTLPPQVPPPPGKLSQIVLPVEDLVSPGNFCVRLACDNAHLMKLLEGMNETPPPAVPGWVVGRRETVAVYYEDIWYRGLAVKKIEGKFSIYLLDFGGALVNVAPDQLRPLPSSLSTTSAMIYQVCLAGMGPVKGDLWGDEVGQVMGEIINTDIHYKLGVEFLGQVEGGRWVVKLRGIEDEEDIGKMMMEGWLAKAREDNLIEINNIANTKVEKKGLTSTDTVKTELKVKPVFVSQPTKSKPAAEEGGNLGPTIPRGVLAANTRTAVGVCFLEKPDKFYVCPSSCIDQFMAILSTAQSTPPGLVSPVLGSSCLAMDEDCWYRAEIVELSTVQTKATLFLLDYGKTVHSALSMLRPIPADLATTPGLVCAVTLRGVKPGDKKWSADEIAGALLVLDVGGETQFKVKNVEVDKEYKTIVSMEDMEGNDVADLMVETGIASKDDDAVMGDLKLVPGNLVLGQQQLLVLSVVSPMDINVCSQAQFLHFSDTIVPMVDEAASKADMVLSLKEGDIVLACEDQVWYRATVIKLLPAGVVKVKLVDLAITANVSKDKLRLAKVGLVKEPVVAVSCCLDSWVDEDRKMAAEKWGDKMEGMLEQYSEVEVEVVNMMDTQARVKIPALEQKLGKKEMSRAEMLKMKLKQKK